MTCREAMQTKFDFCVAEERLTDALEIMSATGGDMVPVVETRQEMRWLGVIRARTAAVRLGLADQRASEIMCRELAEPCSLLAEPTDEVAAWRERMRREGLAAVPVVAAGRLVGMLAGGAPPGPGSPPACH